LHCESLRSDPRNFSGPNSSEAGLSPRICLPLIINKNNPSKFLPFLRYAKDLIGKSDIITLKSVAVSILTRQFAGSVLTKQYQRQTKGYAMA
jgi:hypothetical protein